MAEDYSLGEAIGLQGRFNIAEQTAKAGIAAIDARVKAAQKRAKEDEDFYNRIIEKTQAPKNLQRLFIEPASALGVDAVARIAKAKNAGGEGFKSEAIRIANQLQQDYAELESRSQEWKDWYSEFNRPGNYRTQDQARLASAGRQARDYMDLRQRVQKEGIPGYDIENDLITGRVNYFAPKLPEGTIGRMNKEFSKISMLEGKPVVKKIAGKDQISVEKILFLYDKDAQNYAKLNNIQTPQSIESAARNLLDNDFTFRYQYADELGIDPLDTDALISGMLEVGTKFAKESEKLKSPGTEFNFSIYNSPQNENTPAAVNKRIGQYTDGDNTFINFGNGVVQIDEIPAFTPTGNTVDAKGVLRTTRISNAKPQEVVVLPYIIDTDKTTNRKYEKPLIIGKNQPLSALDLRKAFGFQAYVKMSTATGTTYTPADEFQDTGYLKGSKEYVAAGTGVLSQFNAEGDNMTKYHNANKANANAEFYKLYADYVKDPTLNGPALDKFIKANF